MAKSLESSKSSTPLYESVFVIRQDISSADVDKIVGEFENLIKSYKGDILKKEYWGLRNLAYEISNNKKAHYYFLGITGDNSLLAEFDRKVKLNENIIRSSVVRVEKISNDPSPILKEEDGTEDVVELQNSKPFKRNKVDNFVSFEEDEDE